MAEVAAQGPTEANSSPTGQATEDIELQTATGPKDGAVVSGPTGAASRDSKGKRAREEGDGGEEADDGPSKKQKAEESMEEERQEEESGRVKLGAKEFGSSVEMFDYFFDFLRFWSPNIDINKYEHMMLLDLIKKGHTEPNEKIGTGVKAFQVRYHPVFKNRCFFLVREDESADDFSFRKCVDHITPLPEDMMKARAGFNRDNRGSARGHRGRAGGRKL